MGPSESGEVHKPSLMKEPSFCHLYSRMLATTLVTRILGSLQKYDDLEEGREELEDPRPNI